MEMVPGRHRELIGAKVPETMITNDPHIEYRLVAGQAGIHHPLTPHRSHENRTAGMRRAFLIRLAPWTTKLQHKYGGFADIRRRVVQESLPTWPSHPSRRFMWLPVNADVVANGYQLNRVIVCFDHCDHDLDP